VISMDKMTRFTFTTPRWDRKLRFSENLEKGIYLLGKWHSEVGSISRLDSTSPKLPRFRRRRKKSSVNLHVDHNFSRGPSTGAWSKPCLCLKRPRIEGGQIYLATCP
jgi:hypothetical protein